MQINRFRILKTSAFAATLMIATSACAMDAPRDTSSDEFVQSAIARLSPQEVKELANLPLSNPKSYKHWARPDLIAAIEEGEEKFKTLLSYEDPLYKDQPGFLIFNVRLIQNNPGDTRHYGLNKKLRLIF